MTRWWVAFAIGVPLAYLAGMEWAKADCDYHCKISAINLRNLKNVACQITYKALYDDLQNKYELRKAGLYRMPNSVAIQYQNMVDDFMKSCVPEDSVVDRIERNEAPVDIVWP